MTEAEHTSENNMTIIIVGILGNILSVVGVVMCNKYIIEVDHYNYSVFLSFLHFAFTSVGTRVLLFGDCFKSNTAPLSGILPVAVGSLMSVAFMNMNLAYNSIGFYQVSTFFLRSSTMTFFFPSFFFFVVVQAGLHPIYSVGSVLVLQHIDIFSRKSYVNSDYLWGWICHCL
jgi:hypothetical protein